MASIDIKEEKENDEAAAAAACSRRWDTLRLNPPKKSHWLQTTLSDLDKKTKAMLDMMQDDSDSFAQRAEMYYKKRPQLVEMVEDLSKSYRSLALKYDQLRSHSFRVTNSDQVLSSSSNSSFNQVKQLQNSLNQVQQLQTCHQKKIRDDFESLKKELMANNSRQMEKTVNADQLSDEIESSSDHQIMLFLEREKMWNEMSLKVSKLVEDNLRQQEQLIRSNDKKRQDIEQLYSEMDRLLNENKALKRSQSSCPDKVGDKNQNQRHRASIFKKFFCMRFKT